MSTTTPEEQTFLNWLKTNGAVISPSVGLTQFEGMGRGAIALTDIQPDTLLFSLPRPLLLTTSTSVLPSLLPPSTFSTLGSGWTPLILCMMYESLQTPTWSTYFSLLPKTFNSLMYWSESELSELKGSVVLSKIGKEEAEEEYHDVLLPFVEEHEGVFGGGKEEYTLELFHLMGSLILSRSFHVEAKEKSEKEGEDSDEEEEEEEEEEEREDVADVAMVPMADLLNAKSGCDNARLFYEPTTLNMLSTTFIPLGSQIFNTYADPPNSDLLRRYGHVDEENGADLVEIGLEIVVDLVGGEGMGLGEEEREERAEWLLEMGVDDTFSLDLSHSLPSELLSTIRTFLLPTADFIKAQNKESPPRGKLDPTIAEWARKLLEKREGEYETSVEEDELLLQDPSLAPRRRMAIIVRLGEKRILKATREKLVEEYPVGGGVATKGEKKRKGGEGEGGEKSGKKSRK